MSHTAPAVEATGLRKRYGTTHALDGLDLVVPRGTVHGLLGPNGAGKTTTVRVLSTLVRADAGTARVAGFDVNTQAAHVRSRIALVGQNAAVDEILTGRQNLLLFGRLSHLGSAQAARRADDLLAAFRLTEAGGRPVKQYSGGMRRRLDLAVGLLLAPSVLFLDEPTTGLDPRARAEMWDAVRALADSGTTVVLTTQYLEEADQLADRVAVIDGGRIVEEDTPDGLKRRVGTERLRLALAQPGHAPAAVALQPGAHLDPETGEIVVPLRDPDHLRQVLDDLHRAGFPVASVSLSAPTLDDVFFRLTEKEPAA